jgi:sigma-B regulation protein RsbU (phosphoserine phosphatase)
VALGVASLASNFFQTTDPEARRKIRVIFWGTTIAFAPFLLVAASHFVMKYQDPDWLDVAVILIMFLFPLSFAYAVVKHRVLEIPVLLKRSARYLLVQRGFTVLLGLSIGLILIFGSSTRYFRPLINLAQPAGIAVGAIFGAMLLWGGAQLHKRVSVRIDRAFFRSAYDARMILEDLAQKSRASTDRGELARLLERHLKEALQPTSLAVYLQGSDDSLTTASDAVSEEFRTISLKLPVLMELAQRGQPWEFPRVGEDAAEKCGLEPLHPECLVPVMGRGDQMVGLLVMGPRLSEEPYSGEDKRLLASIAGQAGTALENIRLAGEIADRIEAERRSAREMEIAKEVQARLLPQEPPHLKTLDCAAQCIEARSVGGDYYDFLDLGQDRMGFVLADVSGKGVHAALLMANLQAYLRSQSGITPLDPAGLLQQVNRLLWKATSAEHFATLFFAIYDDSSRQVVYINCGHNPPVWLRQDGNVQRLGATATVIGVFEQWDCSVEQIRLSPGDLLLVFSDGVTEATRNEEEYGEARLIHELLSCRHLPVNEIVQAILASVQEFSAGAQSDDLTLLIAKVRP